MELRNGINCIEPMFNIKTQRLEAAFVPCNFQPEQKWTFETNHNDQREEGMLVHVGTEKCLTFANTKDEQEGRNQKRNNNMLTFLATVVEEAVENVVQTPYISDCKNSRNIQIPNSQKWRLDILTNLEI